MNYSIGWVYCNAMIGLQRKGNCHLFLVSNFIFPNEIAIEMRSWRKDAAIELEDFRR
jgi:hypothetical protein